MAETGPSAPQDETPAAAGSLRAPLERAEQLTQEQAQRLISFLERTEPVKRLRGSQVASAFLGAIGFALFVFGIERASEHLPIVSNAYGSIVVGLLFLAATGVLLERLIKGE